jgi:two-component sensor histidine kinase
MLAELNHRIGNELTAALAALRLVQHSLGDIVEPTGFLEQAVSRLEHFGQLHHILDRNRSHGTLQERLEALCRATTVAKAAPRGVRIALSADDVAVDDEIAWTACVVVSELLTNVLKHAFGDEGGGLVAVELRDEQGTIVLSVADNGAGVGAVPQGAHAGPVQTPGAGWGIVTELTERVGGVVSRHSGSSGTTVRIAVPATLLMP